MKIKNPLIKKNNRKENETGITLVALVVTIVVLLILAGITITLLFGENGIIKKAGDAKNATEQDQIDTEEGLQNLVNQMNEILGENGASASEVAAAPATWYGKTVNYTVSDSTIEEALDTESITWKIFYADSSHIYLIASDYVPNANIPKTKGNTTTSLTTNGTYKAYWSTTALEDYYDSNTGTVTMNSLYQTLNKSHYDYLVDNNSGNYPNNNNIKAVAYMLDTDAWAGYKDSTGKAEYVIGGPTVEMLMASYSQKHNLINEEGKYQYQATATSATGYSISWDYGESTNTYISDSNYYLDTTDSLYINDAGTSKAYGYWVASPSAGSANEVMRVIYCGFVGPDPYGTGNYAFRPLVSLKSNVKLQLQEDGTINIK